VSVTDDAPWVWPSSVEDLVALQARLATAARGIVARSPRWRGDGLVAGCFLAYAGGEQGPGRPGDRGWGAAATCDLADGAAVVEVAVVAGEVGAAYAPGLLALREGPLLGEAVGVLARRPDVVLVDATGADHPRGAGLAVHLGAVLDVATVGVTHRPLRARGPEPGPERGAWAGLVLDGEVVGARVRTRPGAHAVVAHVGWRTTVEDAVAVVLAASSPQARTPTPLRAARMAARGARSTASGRPAR
jgi:deoxyribonuclease V